MGGDYVVYHKCHVQCALLDFKNSVGHQSHWRLRAALTKALPLRAALVAALPICQRDTAAEEEQKIKIKIKMPALEGYTTEAFRL